MDDQRCELPKAKKPVKTKATSGKSRHKAKFGKSNSAEDLLEMLARVQGDRMNEQRCTSPLDEESATLPKSSKRIRDQIRTDIDRQTDLWTDRHTYKTYRQTDI